MPFLVRLTSDVLSLALGRAIASKFAPGEFVAALCAAALYFLEKAILATRLPALVAAPFGWVRGDWDVRRL